VPDESKDILFKSSGARSESLFLSSLIKLSISESNPSRACSGVIGISALPGKSIESETGTYLAAAACKIFLYMKFESSVNVSSKDLVKTMSGATLESTSL